MRYRRFSCWRRSTVFILPRCWRKSGVADVPPVLLPASRMEFIGQRQKGKMQRREVLKLSNSLFVIERARAEDAAALLDYLKIVGGETENLSFGAEGVPLDLETEQSYLRSQCESMDNVQYLAKVKDEIIGTASLNRKHKRMSHRGVFGISLKKAWWGCGAASALTEAILAFAKENDFEQLNLEVRSDNARAIRLYEKYGFRKLCTFPHFFKINGEYVDFDLMNLELNTADDRIGENAR